MPLHYEWLGTKTEEGLSLLPPVGYFGFYPIIMSTASPIIQYLIIKRDIRPISLLGYPTMTVTSAGQCQY